MCWIKIEFSRKVLGFNEREFHYFKGKIINFHYLLPKIKVEIKPNNSFGEGVATPFQGVRDSRDSGHMGLMGNSCASVRDSALILHSVAAPSTF